MYGQVQPRRRLDEGDGTRSRLRPPVQVQRLIALLAGERECFLSQIPYRTSSIRCYHLRGGSSPRRGAWMLRPLRTERTRTRAVESFDDLARGLAKGTVSRRQALTLVGSSLFGGALGSVGLSDDAEASCKSKCDKKAKKRCIKKCEKKQLNCPNLGTACGKVASTLVCNCRLSKEGKQNCANVVNPPNGVAFLTCTLSSDCPKGQICDFGGNVCRRACETI
jgi:hypothetical protein